MELFLEHLESMDQERDPRESSPRSRTGQGRTKSVSSKGRKTGKPQKKKRTTSRVTTAGRRRTAKRSKLPVVPSEPSTRSMPLAEPPPIIPQPSLGAEDEEPTTDEGEQRQEPPAPSARAVLGDEDDLFEYVI
jgi:hypothetical protein